MLLWPQFRLGLTAVFHANGKTDVAEIEDAHSLLSPLLGVGIASVLFAIALLASGLNSTVTATLAGQIVVEGFLRIRPPHWMRRLLTRAIAIVPDVIVTALYGEAGTGRLLILSQVVLNCRSPSSRWCNSCPTARRWGHSRSPGRLRSSHGSSPRLF